MFAARRGLIKASFARVSAQRPVRSFTAAAVRFSSDHGNSEILQGPGGKPGRVPTNFEQSTGDERREYLAAMEGKEYFDLNPLELETKGTRQNPTIVPSGAAWRLVGCNGAPGEAHELMWIRVEREHGIDRCPECGNAFKLSDNGFDPNNLPEAHHHEEH
ncbi:Cytochrome c oxidase subunit 4 [Coemansia sp. RSA 2706]|nr:Cytochrome c oxidase subunit 4 [Coemansia sp. RSA 2711]KAJ2292016.1 Cytochrome c oxidase subunit 4 [Coemansia sp. RSA 2706]KAJ2313991.1 Cytochrome c oxidase subunit 4 [Coemansia sp. RSA 2705]KAJ2318640.1 Cytochrome c oxidase subunit 4 [Coemansia sp. RSA 2704]KAJ2324654.1 Cytochrome c oxidase subunit 4 [Coemansia sp. RSA 2702]KAJ2734907.1 Cytochrome c oxidase subunit 4 [Coemansia sp. Cherry 401B]